MTLKEIIERFDLTVHSGEDNLEREVTGCYISDMLSDVMSNSRRGQLWITLQVHQNVVAVASLRELTGIVVIGGRTPLEETVAKARDEGIPVLTSPLTAFDLSGRLYEAGLRGRS